MHLHRVPITICTVLLALVVALPLAAGAEGMTRVQQSDGSVQRYPGVQLRLNGDRLFVRSPDGKGKLEIASGACSFVGELERCLPYAITLRQAGTSHPIALDRGTVYLNLTSSAHRLRYSSEHVPPHGVLAAFRTFRGTYISIRGTLDGVK